MHISLTLVKKMFSATTKSANSAAKSVVDVFQTSVIYILDFIYIHIYIYILLLRRLYIYIFYIACVVGGKFDFWRFDLWCHVERVQEKRLEEEEI